MLSRFQTPLWSKRAMLRNWLTMMGIAQPQPEAAISLIHKQPVRWIKTRTVSCDGGGGPLGHPKIFINVDKPQICCCTYCGLPFVRDPLRDRAIRVLEVKY